MIKLTVAPSGYGWDFELSLKSPTAPATYGDTGSARCHGGRSELPCPAPLPCPLSR